MSPSLEMRTLQLTEQQGPLPGTEILQAAGEDGILHEGTLLYGSEALFQWIMRMLKEYGVHEKLRTMEEQSYLFRKKAEEYLLTESLQTIRESDMSLFYPVEESEDFSLF